MDMYVMTDRPDKRTLITTGCYWFVAFFLLPVFLLYLVYGFQDNDSVLGWVQFCYYGTNALCTFFIFREHLADGWFTLRMEAKKVLLTVAACAGSFAAVYGLLMLAGITSLRYAIPVSELELLLMPEDLVRANPVFGTLSLTVFTPLTISCLLYGLGFSPACNVHPVLGYAVVLAVLGLHRALNYYTVGTVELEQMMYAVQLPAHILACVAYHKTNTVLAPVLFHALINLLSCLWILL